MPVKRVEGLEPGARVVPVAGHQRMRIGPQLLGRVVNGLGQPLDDAGPLVGDEFLDFAPQEINPDRKSTRLNSSHVATSYAVFCSKKQRTPKRRSRETSTTGRNAAEPEGDRPCPREARRSDVAPAIDSARGECLGGPTGIRHEPT